MTHFRHSVFLACVALFSSVPLLAQDSKIESLPDTKALEWSEEDLSKRLMDGAHAFVERQIAESKEKRAQFWNYDFSSPVAYAKSIEPNRERFRKMIGVVDERVSPVRMEEFGDEQNPALVRKLAEPEVLEPFEIFQVRWPVVEGVFAEGLLSRPVGKSEGVVIVVPDADQQPEELFRLVRDPKPSFSKGSLSSPDDDGSTSDQQLVRELAENYTLVVPTLINRETYLGPEGNDPRLKRTEQSHREWIYRQAFQMGRHAIGYEVQMVLAAVDWAERNHPDLNVCVTGYGEGGLVALYAAASDSRIDAAYVRGYVGPGQDAWKEPIHRNFFGGAKEFGPAEIFSLVLPRPMMIATVDAPVAPPNKGEISPVLPSAEKVVAGHPAFEWEVSRHRFWAASGEIHPLRVSLFFTQLEEWFGNPGITIEPSAGELKDERKNFSPIARHNRLFRQLEKHVQSLIPKADDLREESFLFQAEPKLRPGKWSTNKEHPTLDPANFIENARSFRKKFNDEAMGNFDEPLVPPNPRTRKILETEKWTAWDVVLDVYAPEFFAWGTLLLPKDLKSGEKRPVVVCQHGRNGVPRDTIDAGSSAYNDFAAKLAERGFITFAPHNLYRGEDRYRWLDRKANSIGCTLFSFIIPSHRQILDWLKTQPNVDPEKVAFYGLSYGGETAMRVPPVIEDYAAVICSGDFNQWTRKVAAVDFPGSFMNTIEWEMPYWNLGNTFDYAEMAYLIFPRPFMVERGHHDRVSRDHWVAHEYAKVRWLYAQFGMEDKTEIEYFQGGHSINGKGTFEFLHKHLDWPKPENSN